MSPYLHPGAVLALVLALAACDDGGSSRPTAAPKAVAQPGAATSRTMRTPLPQPAVEDIAAAAAIQRLAPCTEGIAHLQRRMGALRGRTEAAAARSALTAALAAHRVGDADACESALAPSFAALGYEFIPQPQPLPCANGIVGAIAQLPRLHDFQQKEVQSILENAIADMEAGNFDACWLTLGTALTLVREYIENG